MFSRDFLPLLQERGAKPDEKKRVLGRGRRFTEIFSLENEIVKENGEFSDFVGRSSDAEDKHQLDACQLSESDHLGGCAAEHQRGVFVVEECKPAEISVNLDHMAGRYFWSFGQGGPILARHFTVWVDGRVRL